jgi:hypothetical protein
LFDPPPNLDPFELPAADHTLGQLTSFRIWSRLLNSSPARHQVDDEHNQRNDKQQVNQSTANVTKKPE